MGANSSTALPRWYLIPARALLVSFIATLISFAVSLLLGIVGTVGVAWAHGTQPNMTVAYRMVALPVSLTAGSIVLVLALAMEIRHYRQRKILAAIERAG